MRNVLLIGLMAWSPFPTAWSSPWPEVRVSHVRRVFDNGEHNAFTDLVWFQNRIYLAFRSCPDGHMVHPTSSIILLSSADGKEWQQVHRFGVAKRDTRDPHFLVFQNRLFLYTGTWYSGDATLALENYDLNQHLGYAVWSADGKSWEGPRLLEGTFGHYVWRAASYGGKAYLCARRKKDFDMQARGEGPQVESLLLESEDGLVWRRRAVFQEIEGDETAFQFESDGTILAIGRRGRDTAQFLRSRPPYTDWERRDLGQYVGGPLLTRWGKHWLVGGRKMDVEFGAQTSMCWMRDGVLHEFAVLPSGGDNSYPGFVELESGHGLVSWYSSHEQGVQGATVTAIYLAELEMVAPHDP